MAFITCPVLRTWPFSSTLPLVGAFFLSITSCAPSGSGGSSNTMMNRFTLDDDGVVISLGEKWLRLQVVSDDIIRVTFAKDRQFFAQPSLAVLPSKAIRPSV